MGVYCCIQPGEPRYVTAGQMSALLQRVEGVVPCLIKPWDTPLKTPIFIKMHCTLLNARYRMPRMSQGP